MLLDEGARLLTLTGPGGVGKTRLVLEVAAGVEDSFAEGARFVDLSPLQDPSLLVSAIGRACGLLHESAQSPLYSLSRALGERELLLVLDNCEHLLAAAGDIGALLEACRTIKVLATSREPLRLSLEWELPVPPLARPKALSGDDLPTDAEVDALTENASVALFVQRARAVRPTFGLSKENARAVAELCIRLDGLPLAIELAAARTRFLPPIVLLARLERRLDLQSPARDVPERHRTLREAIAWSYTLLSPDQQAVFRRLSVFVGGCSLEAAQAVSGLVPSAETEDVDVFEVLFALVERNLLLSDDDGRFRYLETVREFALERLEAMGEGEATHAAHAEYYLELAEAADPAVRGREQRAWLDRLERTADNLRVALRWLVDRDEEDALDDAARMCWGLWHFWWARGYPAEGRRWAEAILARPAAGPLACARAAWVVSTAALDSGDYAAAPAHIQTCLRVFRELDDRRGFARALLVEGWAAPIDGDMGRAIAAHQESADVARDAGDEGGLILALAGLANTYTVLGDYNAAWRHNEEALALAEQHGDLHSHAQVREALGLVALEQGDLRRAAAQFRASARLCLDVGSLELLCYCLVGLAGVALADAALERAVQLLAAAEGLRERADLGVWPVREAMQRRLVEAVRSRLIGSTAVLAQTWAAGRALSMLEAAELALSDSAPAAVNVAASSSAGLLTQRELEVARLIAQGKTSKEIADVLVISERTADTHAGHIRDKLGVRSRAEIAAWVVREGLQAASDS